MFRSGEVQHALYAALVSDITINSMVNAVKDNPDQNTQPPYITIGESTSVPADLLVETGSEETVTVQIWDKARGMEYLKAIMQRIYQVLHYQRLNITGGTQFVQCRCEDSLTFKEPDGETRRGVMRFRISTFG